MSKPVKSLITESYRKHFAEVEGAVLVDIRGIASNNNNKLRAGLAKTKVKVTVVKNSLARTAFKGTKLESIEKLLEGPSALVYGGDSVVSVARDLLEQLKTIENVQVKGALMDGQLFGADEIEALSKMPTRVEAQGQLITLLLSPAKKLAGQILGPGRKIASLVKAIEEKKSKEEPAAATA